MIYQYTINDISTECKVSKQSLYALIKKNQAFINENSTRKQRKIYYNQAVMDFFVSYYSAASPDKAENPRQNDHQAEGCETTGENPPSAATFKDDTQKYQIDALNAQIDALQAEIGALRRQLEEKEEERKELIRQNGALILTLQQEKQEKQLFLPAPKKSFGDKVKSLFKSK